MCNRLNSRRSKTAGFSGFLATHLKKNIGKATLKARRKMKFSIMMAVALLFCACLQGCGNNETQKNNKKDFENTSEIIVKTEKLDTWISDKNIHNIDLIWLDVQGSEKDVLLGAINTLPRVSYIWTEYGEKEYDDAMGRDDTIEFLKKYNFCIMEECSSQDDSGDLLFYNKNIFVHCKISKFKKDKDGKMLKI